MFGTAFMALVSGMLLSLRLGTGSGSFPKPLSADEEREAVDRWVNQGDLSARNLLIEHNLRLVAHIIKKYYAQTADQEDLISIGTVGLIKGVSTYRADKNVRLATYASRCIENAILSPARFTARIGAIQRNVPRKPAAGTSCFPPLRVCLYWPGMITARSATLRSMSTVSDLPHREKFWRRSSLFGSFTPPRTSTQCGTPALAPSPAGLDAK